MNERIKELWSQAGGHYDSGNQHTWPQYTIDNPEKFAMLIIKKCRDIVSDTRDLAIEEEWNVDEAMSTAMYDIEEYFGVEE
jgi:hypothetical protein